MTKKITVIMGLPNPGDTFLMPLADGRFGLCRVLDVRTQRIPSALVVASPWIGTEPPDLADPVLREHLILTHHSWNKATAISWAIQKVPRDFRLLGTLKPTKDELALDKGGVSTWAYFPLQVLLQWRWDNDRDALLGEEKMKKDLERIERERNAIREKERIARLTWDDLRSKQFFPTWKSYPSKKLTRASEVIMQQTVEDLQKLGESGSRTAKRNILKECIERFNQLDGENKHFIETVEREDICNQFYEIAHVAGFDDEPNLADEWREW